MWIHLLSLGLIDGAGGGVEPPPEQRNSAGFAWLGRKPYKYKYQIPQDALQAVETAAKERVDEQSEVALRQTMERLGVVYRDAYRLAFIEILVQLRAEQAAQEAEDEQIAQILAVLM